MSSAREHPTRTLVVVAEVADDFAVLGDLRATLAEVEARVGDLETTDLIDTHFMRFVILDDREQVANRLPTLLVWECNHDGKAAEYLRELYRSLMLAQDHGNVDLDSILAACIGYPGMDAEERWVDWLLTHRVRSEASYCGYPGVPQRSLAAARRVRESIREFVESHRRELGQMSPSKIHERITGHIRSDNAKLTADDLAPTPKRRITLRRWLTLTTISLAVLILETVLLPLTIVWYMMLRRHEGRDRALPVGRPVHVRPELSIAEDRIAQNNVTHVVDIKPGTFRYFTIRAVLFAIDQLARIHYVHGELGGITSLHFANWLILHDHREDVDVRRHRVLFLASFDRTVDSLLDEFVTRAAGGPTAVWSNTVGFPRTRNLTGGGARDEAAFRQWVRNGQRRSHVWWSGSPTSTVESIHADLRVRRGLDAHLEGDELQRWLQVL